MNEVISELDIITEYKKYEEEGKYDSMDIMCEIIKNKFGFIIDIGELYQIENILYVIRKHVSDSYKINGG